ncbi:hypothetical protein Tco_0299094 [Tanacetum coccineum]
MKPKTQYQPKAKQSTTRMTPAALNVDKSIIEEVATGSKGKLVLVDDDGKPLEKVDYRDDDDEVEHVKNESASFLA